METQRTPLLLDPMVLKPVSLQPVFLKLWPAFGDIAFLLPLMLLFGRLNGVKTLLWDCDTGWHIRTGDWIMAHRAVPFGDIFSFSKPGQPWFAWEWLSDVMFAWLNGHGGLPAVVIFCVVLLSLTFGLLFRLLRTRSNVIVAMLITILAAVASSVHWLARPHLFTLLFLVVFYGILERVGQGQTRLAGIPCLAILPVATVFWTNLHGGFVAGILMIATYGAGELLKLAFAEHREAAAGRRAGAYFLCALGCLAASLINPYGYRLHVHVAGYLRDPFNSQHIVEFLSPNFHTPEVVFFEALLVLAAAAACWSVSRGRYTEPLLLAMWGHAALLAGRNIEIFAIAAALPVAKAIQEVLSLAPEADVAEWVRRAALRFNRVAARTSATEAGGRWHFASAMGLLLVAVAICGANPSRKFRAEFDPQRYPQAALAILREDPAARVFTDDEWGDYLIWSLYPAQRVFVDGRTDFYGAAFEEQFLDVLAVKYDWEKTLGRFGVDTILLPTNAPLAGALKESSRWRLVYDDGVALVFRPAGKNVGTSSSVARTGDGYGRDREVTKIKAGDRSITPTKLKT